MSSRGNIYPTRVHYEYKIEDTARVQYAHGVWGGVTKHGEIELNFYLEHDNLGIRKETHTQHKEVVQTHYITRLVHSRILLNYATARSVLEWLEEKVETLELEEDETQSYSVLDYDSKQQ